jgi:hypothetical protein
MSIGRPSVRSLTGRGLESIISWIVTAAAFTFILGVIVAHGAPCIGSTTQQVATIARMGGQPGLMTFFCADCGTANSIWSILATAPGEESTSTGQGTSWAGAVVRLDGGCRRSDGLISVLGW